MGVLQVAVFLQAKPDQQGEADDAAAHCPNTDQVAGQAATIFFLHRCCSLVISLGTQWFPLFIGTEIRAGMVAARLPRWCGAQRKKFADDIGACLSLPIAAKAAALRALVIKQKGACFVDISTKQAPFTLAVTVGFEPIQGDFVSHCIAIKTPDHI